MRPPAPPTNSSVCDLFTALVLTCPDCNRLPPVLLFSLAAGQFIVVSAISLPPTCLPAYKKRRRQRPLGKRRSRGEGAIGVRHGGQQRADPPADGGEAHHRHGSRHRCVPFPSPVSSSPPSLMVASPASLGSQLNLSAICSCRFELFFIFTFYPEFTCCKSVQPRYCWPCPTCTTNTINSKATLWIEEPQSLLLN